MNKKSGLSICGPVVTFQDEGAWFAHSLALDILGDGKSRTLALNCLKRLLAVHLNFCIKKKALEANYRIAPKKDWDKFNKSKKEDKWFVSIEGIFPFKQKHQQSQKIRLEAYLV